MKNKIKLFTGLYLINKKFLKNQNYYFLKTPKISMIIPKIKDKFLLISQYRIPIRKRIYEFPGGDMLTKVNQQNKPLLMSFLKKLAINQ